MATAKRSKATHLVAGSVRAVGGLDALMALRDVQYRYTYRDPEGLEDVSLERYVFDGERSWARYTKHDKFVLPGEGGEVVQGYDGHKTWATLDGRRLDDPQTLKVADFMRKTNFYWMAMMHKLLDPGTTHEYKGRKTIDGKPYDVVSVGFDDGIGDVADTYVLYINRRTHLVDRFLFTVMDFGMAEPHLMLVDYAQLGTVKLPATRRYAPANWEGEVVKEQWAHEIMDDILFDNGFTTALFHAP